MTDIVSKLTGEFIKNNAKIMAVINWMPRVWLGLENFEVEVNMNSQTITYCFKDSKGHPMMVKCKDDRVLREFMPMKTGLKGWTFKFEARDEQHDT